MTMPPSLCRPATSAEVAFLFEAILGRPPDDAYVAAIVAGSVSTGDLILALRHSEELRHRAAHEHRVAEARRHAAAREVLTACEAGELADPFVIVPRPLLR